MRRVIPCLLVTGLIVLAGTGCSGRHRRPYDSNPFSGAPQARASRSPAVTDSLLSPPDSKGPEVTPAGGDYEPPATKPREVVRSSHNFRLPADEVHEPVADSPPRAASTSRPRSGAAMDHAPDYAWIQGRLEHSALGGGVWKVRFAPISADDEHGGSVILESSPDANRYQAGDTVFVEGQIVSNERRAGQFNPVYRVKRMNVVQK